MNLVEIRVSFDDMFLYGVNRYFTLENKVNIFVVTQSNPNYALAERTGIFISIEHNPKAVFLTKSLFDILTLQELEALAYHELGHLKLGHLENKIKVTVPGMKNTIVVADESAADKYAISVVGKAIYRKAFIKNAKYALKLKSTIGLWVLFPIRMLKMSF